MCEMAHYDHHPKRGPFVQWQRSSSAHYHSQDGGVRRPPWAASGWTYWCYEANEDNALFTIKNFKALARALQMPREALDAAPWTFHYIMNHLELCSWIVEHSSWKGGLFAAKHGSGLGNAREWKYLLQYNARRTVASAWSHAGSACQLCYNMQRARF